MLTLLYPSYFPNIAHFTVMANCDNFIFEINDNYQKQTYRNRCEIYGANGKLNLTVPVSYTQKHRQQFKDVEIHNVSDWQKQHLKSLEAAYRMSPFYEFYIDELMPIFTDQFQNLLQLNLKTIDLISNCLELDLKYSLTKTYRSESENDYRYLINAKQNTNNEFKNYVQVFTRKHGFLPNLSVLDLLFNEGPNTVLYLKSQSV